MEKEQKKITKKINKYTIILTVILLIGIITRIVGLGQIPIGINVDEAGIMYDAYCIANYGTDRFDNPYPVYMINYGGGQSSLYTYLAALFIKIFGFNLITVRLPALIFSILYIIFGFLITKSLKNKKLAILVEFLIVICPWQFMQSRWALDCNLLSSMLLISLYILTKAVSKQSKTLYFITGIFLGFTLYTYALSYIIIPVILLVLFAYLLYAKKIKISDIVILGIPLGILATPLILFVLVNYGVLEEIKLPFISILKMWLFRNEAINTNNILQNILYLFKSMFAFDINDYNAFPIFGTLYYISIPFTVIGFITSLKEIIKNVKEKEFSLDIVMFANFLAVVICSLLIQPVVSRINAIYISLIYYTALGIVYVSNNKKRVLNFFIVLYVIFYIAFLSYYFGVYGKENTNMSFNNDAIEVTEYLEKNEKFKGKRINFRVITVQPYIYTLIGNKTLPHEFEETIATDNGLVLSYGRYTFYSNEIDDNTVYVLDRDEISKKILLDNGFKLEEYNEHIYILYKE